MDGKEKSVLEWYGKVYAATIKVSGGRRLNLELPGNYSLEHQERRADGVLVLSFGVPCNASPSSHEREDAPGNGNVAFEEDIDEETGCSHSDSRCVKLKVANNFKVKFPRRSQGAQGPE